MYRNSHCCLVRAIVGTWLGREIHIRLLFWVVIRIYFHECFHALCDQPLQNQYDPTHLTFWWAVTKHHRHYYIPLLIHTNKHPQMHACKQRAHISPATVEGYSPLSCSASYNIFSGCCVCTHRNHVITACQGFLCRETFAYSNVLRSEACHGWFSDVHIHTVGLCSCSAQLMDASGSLFPAFFTLDFHNKIKRRELAWIRVPHHIYACVCARLNSLIPMHKHISDLQPVYSLPRDAISLQIKDNGGQVHTECTETIPTLQLYHIHTQM